MGGDRLAIAEGFIDGCEGKAALVGRRAVFPGRAEVASGGASFHERETHNGSAIEIQFAIEFLFAKPAHWLVSAWCAAVTSALEKNADISLGAAFLFDHIATYHTETSLPIEIGSAGFLKFLAVVLFGTRGRGRCGIGDANGIVASKIFGTVVVHAARFWNAGLFEALVIGRAICILCASKSCLLVFYGECARG